MFAAHSTRLRLHLIRPSEVLPDMQTSDVVRDDQTNIMRPVTPDCPGSDRVETGRAWVKTCPGPG